MTLDTWLINLILLPLVVFLFWFMIFGDLE